MPTLLPLANSTKRWSPLTWTTKRAGATGMSSTLRKRYTPASRSGAPAQAIHWPFHGRCRTASEIGRRAGTSARAATATMTAPQVRVRIQAPRPVLMPVLPLPDPRRRAQSTTARPPDQGVDWIHGAAGPRLCREHGGVVLRRFLLHRLWHLLHARPGGLPRRGRPQPRRSAADRRDRAAPRQHGGPGLSDRLHRHG